MKRRKLQEIESNWESFTDYILHTAFSRKLAEPNDIEQSSSLGHWKPGHVKRSIVDSILYDGSNSEVLQCAFVPNPFPYNLIDGHHWTLWYNSSTQPHCDIMITEDVKREILAELGPTTPFDFAWQVIANNFTLSCLYFLFEFLFSPTIFPLPPFLITIFTVVFLTHACFLTIKWMSFIAGI